MKEKIDLSALFKSDEDAKKELISLKKYAKNISNQRRGNENGDS